MPCAPHTPICPKCGYDQSGTIATWTTKCPLQGICPECGLNLDWADVIDPSRFDLSWYIEHARNKRTMIRRTFPTLSKLLFPNRFWNDVGVKTQIRYWPLVRWLLLLCVCAHTISTIPVAMGNLTERGWPRSGVKLRISQMNGVVDNLLVLSNAIGAPFFRVVHSRGSTSIAFGGYVNQDLTEILGVVAVFLCLILAWCVIMLVIPVTRKHAQVRRGHVYRAWLVSSVCVIINFELIRITLGLLGWGRSGALLQEVRVVYTVIFIVSIIWVQWFWVAAIRIGWGIKKWRLLSILGVITSLLSGGIVFINVFVLNN